MTDRWSIQWSSVWTCQPVHALTPLPLAHVSPIRPLVAYLITICCAPADLTPILTRRSSPRALFALARGKAGPACGAAMTRAAGVGAVLAAAAAMILRVAVVILPLRDRRPVAAPSLHPPQSIN